MLVREDGSIAGSIGGGLLEHSMMQAAAESLAERRSRRASVDLSGADLTSGDKMVCGGAAEVLITYVPPGDAELLAVCAALREARDAGRRAWYVTVCPATAARPSSTACWTTKAARPWRRGLRGGAAARPYRRRRAPRHGGAPGRPHRRRSSVWIRRRSPSSAAPATSAPPSRRSSPDSASAWSSSTTARSSRRRRGSRTRASSRVRSRGALAAVGVDERAYVVIVTRGHVHDLDVLEQALRLGARYVGVMASRSKRARMQSFLSEAGFGDADLARIHSPIGLAIGAETPAELAVSIAAEIVQVRSGTDA